MPITIGSNIASLNAQKKLSDTSAALSKTYERLSSGLRINSASDDSAGLSIAESLSSDKRVLLQGVRNLNDGISLLNIADSAIQNLSDVTIRLKELSEQAANGSYSLAQRKALNAEAQALSKEYFRIAQSTKFNGINLFDGSLSGGIRLQAGYGTDGSIFSGIGGAIGTGSFAAGSTYSAGGLPYNTFTSDLNGDGNADLVVANVTSLNVMLGNGSGGFSDPVSYSGIGGYDVMAVDVNNDGVMDIVGSMQGSASIGVLIGNGDGTFGSAATFATGSGPYALTAGDFNGDGFMDIATADNYSNTMSILIGNGNGTFISSVSYAAGAGPVAITRGDINGDGILDLVTADLTANRLSVFLGNGDGTFAPRTSILSGTSPRSVIIGDFNGDGKNDLVSADYASNRVSVYLGNGDGSFAPRVSYTVGTGPRDVLAGDFNGDGILDLATAERTTNSLSVLIGNGNGTFQSRVSYDAGGAPDSINSGDFNNDGVLDIIATNRIFASISIFNGNTREGVAPLLSFDLTTQADARQAFSLFNNKIQQLSGQRGKIGAFQSRTQIAVNVLQATSENYAAAEGRIRNADIAEESSKLVQLSILQQAASAVLAQANLQPQLVLKLLSTRDKR